MDWNALFAIFLLNSIHLGSCANFPATRSRFNGLNSLQEFLDGLSPTNGNVPTQCSGTLASLGSNAVQGVCVSAASCSRAGGSVLGTCATRGLTCCVVPITASSSTLRTQITNKAVLLTQSGVANAENIFEFPLQNGICSLTVKFLDTRLVPPSSQLLSEGDCIVDSITVQDSPTLHAGFITVCGDMTGQHMHLSYRAGALGDHPSDKIVISVKTTAATAKYSLNVVQVGCDDPDLVASYCLQKFVADAGQVRSFGYPRQLNNQYYHICTHGPEPGARTVTWQECTSSPIGGSAAPKFFVTGSRSPTDGSLPPPKLGDYPCFTDYLYNTLLNPPSRHCGGSFPKITVDGGLGHLTVNFDENEYGHAAILLDLPPGAPSCEQMTTAETFPSHNCHRPLIGDAKDTSCVCSIIDEHHLIGDEITVTPAENCPTVTEYYCNRTTPSLCYCYQQYDDINQENTGFCLQFTHNY